MTARDAAAERALLVMDLVVGGLSREGAEAKVAASGFAECPCRVADELLRRVKVAGRGE